MMYCTATKYYLLALIAITEAEYLDVIGTKVLVFLLAIHSHLYNFVLRFWFLQTHATSDSFYRRRILGRNWDKSLKSFASFYSQSPLVTNFTPPTSQSGLKPVNIVYGNLKSENSQEYAQNPQRNCTFMNSASARIYKSSKPVAEFIDSFRELKPAYSGVKGG